MLHVVDSMKPPERLVADLEQAISRHKFGLLGVHDLRAKMAKKGVSLNGIARVPGRRAEGHRGVRALSRAPRR